jgi:hypothetical protein
MPTASADDEDDSPRPPGCADWARIGRGVAAWLLATGWWFVTLMESGP